MALGMTSGTDKKCGSLRIHDQATLLNVDVRRDGNRQFNLLADLYATEKGDPMFWIAKRRLFRSGSYLRKDGMR